MYFKKNFDNLDGKQARRTSKNKINVYIRKFLTSWDDFGSQFRFNDHLTIGYRSYFYVLKIGTSMTTAM